MQQEIIMDEIHQSRSIGYFAVVASSNRALRGEIA
jgi:hypothetical protein